MPCIDLDNIRTSLLLAVIAAGCLGFSVGALLGLWLGRSKW